MMLAGGLRLVGLAPDALMLAGDARRRPALGGTGPG